jgi:geranylgeranyl pyrophosphate synthase
MVGGQAIDLAAAGKVPARTASLDRIEALEDMHARKTGALIRASVEAGAVLAGADDRVTRAIGEYGRHVGLAFQIIDDVLDVEGTNEALGKTAGKDARAGKPTYPAFYGIDRSRALAADCVARAHAALATVGVAGRLPDIASWSLTRRT